MKKDRRGRQLSPLDKLICGADEVLRTLSGGSGQAQRPSPGDSCEEGQLSPSQRQHIAGLMRVNHTGEVCAQALYQGQALTAKLPKVRQEMEQAAAEEGDHLVWCEKRLRQLGSHPSYLNGAWYGLSFLLGASAGIAGDKWSLGFVAATEERVCAHLNDHLQQLPAQDQRSRQILQQMLIDEQAHGAKALDAGGVVFPQAIKTLMGAVSKLMTASSYRL